MLAHVFSFARKPRGSPDFLAHPVPKACRHILGTWVPRRLGVARSASSPKAVQALGCSLTPGAPDIVWPGQLHGTGCLSARALDAGFPTVVWSFCLGPGCGWPWVSVTPPVLAGVLGGRVWVRFVVSSLFCRLGFVVFVVGLGFRPAPHLSLLGIWDARGCVRAPPAPRRFWFRCAVWACVLVSASRLRPSVTLGGVGVCVCSCARPAWSSAPPGWGCCAVVRLCARALLVPRRSWLGCAVWACVLGPGLRCAPPFLVGLSGCVFFLLVLLWLCRVGRWLSLSRALWSLSPHPLSFGLGCWLLFFSSSQRGVCLRILGVPSPGGPLLLAWCCRLWLGGPPVPLWGSCLRCLPVGGFGRPLWCWRTVW